MIKIIDVRQLGGYMLQHFDGHHDIVEIVGLKGNKATNYEHVLRVKIATPGDEPWYVFFTLTFDFHGGVSGIDGVAGYCDEETRSLDGRRKYCGHLNGKYGHLNGKYCGHLNAETSYRPCYFFDPQKLDDYMRGIFGALYDMVTD